MRKVYGKYLYLPYYGVGAPWYGEWILLIDISCPRGDGVTWEGVGKSLWPPFRLSGPQEGPPFTRLSSTWCQESVRRKRFFPPFQRMKIVVESLKIERKPKLQEGPTFSCQASIT